MATFDTTYLDLRGACPSFPEQDPATGEIDWDHAIAYLDSCDVMYARMLERVAQLERTKDSLNETVNGLQISIEALESSLAVAMKEQLAPRVAEARQILEAEKSRADDYKQLTDTSTAYKPLTDASMRNPAILSNLSSDSVDESKSKPKSPEVQEGLFPKPPESDEPVRPQVFARRTLRRRMTSDSTPCTWKEDVGKKRAPMSVPLMPLPALEMAWGADEAALESEKVPPWMLTLSSFKTQAFEGSYRLVDGRTMNGYPVWKLLNNDFYLFSSADGILLLRNSAPHREAVEDYTGGIIASVHRHRGKMPHAIEVWQYFDGEDWKIDKDIIFTLIEQDRPASVTSSDDNDVVQRDRPCLTMGIEAPVAEPILDGLCDGDSEASVSSEEMGFALPQRCQTLYELPHPSTYLSKVEKWKRNLTSAF